MPTGYTADVQDGKTTEFRDFALQCARAFGATIDMRDDPLDKPIPEAFDASDWHRKQLEYSRKELERVQSLSSADVAAECEDENKKLFENYEESCRKHAIYRERYRAMLKEVLLWSPPSPDHENLKKFMREQLEQSIEHDCSDWEPPKTESPAGWRTRRIATLKRDIEYHENGDNEERERTASRNRWIRQLRESLA